MPLQGRRIAFIGAGNIAEALIKGLIASKAVVAADLVGTGRRAERLKYLEETFGIGTSTDNVQTAKSADIILMAVKPQIMERVLKEIAAEANPNALVISVAAGVSIGHMERYLGPHFRVCRAMPNTPALVGEGATAISGGPHCTEDDLLRVRTIFQAVGMVVEVDESLLDAVTGLSGSGPAYVFTMIEALADAGVKVGLSRRQSQALAAQTVVGAARLLIETGEHPGVLKDQVTSPGGAAIAGLHTLEQGGVRTTLINAVEAATKRSKQLGQAHSEDD